MIGRSPSHGVLSAELLPTFFSRPPMTKLFPEPSSTAVSARRVARAGMVQPPKLTEPASLSSDTSERTRIEMRPSLSTVGVKARPTPYGLYSNVEVPGLAAPGHGHYPPHQQ